MSLITLTCPVCVSTRRLANLKHRDGADNVEEYDKASQKGKSNLEEAKTLLREKQRQAQERRAAKKEEDKREWEKGPVISNEYIPNTIDLRGVDLEGALLCWLDLSGADCRGANFRYIWTYTHHVHMLTKIRMHMLMREDPGVRVVRRRGGWV